MRLAIIDEYNNIFVEYDAKTFRELLVEYGTKYPTEIAFDKVVRDLRKEVTKKLESRSI